jgi:hypothetical protein
MHNLSLHCQNKEYNPIAEEYRPEDRNVEYRKDDKCNAKGFRDGIPERRLISQHGFSSTFALYFREIQITFFSTVAWRRNIQAPEQHNSYCSSTMFLKPLKICKKKSPRK